MRYVLAWFPMILIAVANGALRQAWLLPRLGARRAGQVSTLLLIALFAGYIWIVVHMWPIGSAGQALAIGLAWLVLTVGFEFALGRWGSRLSWEEMLAEYNLAQGRLWALVPLWVSVAPLVYYRLLI